MSAFMAVGGVWLALECSNGRTKVRFNLKKKQQMADFPPRPACLRLTFQRGLVYEGTILRTQTVVRFLPNLWWRFLWLVSGRGQVRGWRGSSQKGAERPPGDGNGYTTPPKVWSCIYAFFYEEKLFHPTCLLFHEISTNRNKINQKWRNTTNQYDRGAHPEEPPLKLGSPELQPLYFVRNNVNFR